MRHIVLLLVLILVVVVSGCATLPFNSQPRNVATEVNPNQPGQLSNKGVTLKFVEGKPPQDRIRIGIPFRVELLLQNWGTKDISGIVYLSDTPTGNLEAIPGRISRSFLIKGREAEFGQTVVEEEIDFDTFAYSYSSLTNAAIRAELEYDYEADFITQLCVKGEEANVREQECTSRTSFSINDLGPDARNSPVAITSIKQQTDAVNDQAFVTLIITFQDFGGSDGWINNDDRSLNIAGAINLEGSGVFNCNQNIIKFTDTIKTREAYCTLTVSLPAETNYFQNPLIIKLAYPYKTVVATKQIPVVAVEQEFNQF